MLRNILLDHDTFEWVAMVVYVAMGYPYLLLAKYIRRKMDWENGKWLCLFLPGMERVTSGPANEVESTAIIALCSMWLPMIFIDIVLLLPGLVELLFRTIGNHREAKLNQSAP